MITIAETKDARLVAAMNEWVQQLHHQLHPDVFKPYDKDEAVSAFTNMLAGPDCRAFIALQNNTPVGYAIFMIKEVNESPFRFKGRSLYIDQLAVLEEYRSRGVGKLLLTQAETLAKELGANMVELDYWTANIVAASFFHKNGFAVYRQILSKAIDK